MHISTTETVILTLASPSVLFVLINTVLVKKRSLLSTAWSLAIHGCALLVASEGLSDPSMRASLLWCDGSAPIKSE